MNRTEKKPVSHELSLFVVNGTSYPTSPKRFRQVIFSRAFFIVLGVFLSLMIVAKVAIYGQYGGIVFQATFWGLTFVLLISLWYGQFILLSKFRPSWAPDTLPTVILHILPLLICSVSNKALTNLWFGTYTGLEWPGLQTFIQLYLLTIILEFMVTAWVLPYIPGTLAAQARTEALKRKERALRTLSVGDDRFLLSDIGYVKSAEHYVEVVTQDRMSIHRAKFSEIIEQFEPDDGIQTHRSYWVAGDWIQSFDCVGRRKVVTLTNGTQIPVARSRQDAVAYWINVHRPT